MKIGLKVHLLRAAFQIGCATVNLVVGRAAPVELQLIAISLIVASLAGVASAIVFQMHLNTRRPLLAVLETEEAFRLSWRFFSVQLSGEELPAQVEELLVTNFLARHQAINRQNACGERVQPPTVE